MKKNIIIGVIISSLMLFAGIGNFHAIASDEAPYKQLKLFTEVIDMIEKNYVDHMETDKLIEEATKGMVKSLDPHSDLLTPEDLKQLSISTKGKFGGLGIVITLKDELLTVISPIEGTPAYKIGVKSNDIIIKIDGNTTQGMSLSEAVSLLRGKKGTTVTIAVVREEATQPIEFTITRDIIPIHSVKYATLQSGYGYVRITNFQENTTLDTINALQKLNKENNGLKGLLLDLRNNPGGLLEQSITVADIFLEKGKILTVKGRESTDQKVYTANRSNNGDIQAYPIIVLANGGSASASEIVAGALQDNKRALILGTRTFGKGSVQNVKRLNNGYALKLTIAKYYTPSGKSIQAKGIEPDIEEAYKFLKEEENPEENRIKEKDLVNHIEAEPAIKEEKQTKEEEHAYGELIIENLLADSQVKRGLDLLVGYNRFIIERDKKE
ncbi:MAG: S41 family peptidase [Deltaproteobacteria bacterium]|nr:S41 family peptidase [Deltaproteobacteria bacterium]